MCFSRTVIFACNHIEHSEVPCAFSNGTVKDCAQYHSSSCTSGELCGSDGLCRVEQSRQQQQLDELDLEHARLQCEKQKLLAQRELWQRQKSPQQESRQQLLPTSDGQSETPVEQPKRKRGRPLGSKNKNKKAKQESSLPPRHSIEGSARAPFAGRSRGALPRLLPRLTAPAPPAPALQHPMSQPYYFAGQQGYQGDPRVAELEQEPESALPTDSDFFGFVGIPGVQQQSFTPAPLEEEPQPEQLFAPALLEGQQQQQQQQQLHVGPDPLAGMEMSNDDEPDWMDTFLDEALWTLVDAQSLIDPSLAS